VQLLADKELILRKVIERCFEFDLALPDRHLSVLGHWPFVPEAIVWIRQSSVRQDHDVHPGMADTDDDSADSHQGRPDSG
jgi:hypothetical protein